MHKHLATALSALPGVMAAFSAQAHGAAETSGDWHAGWSWGSGHMAFGSLTMILFWGGLILLIVLAVRWFGGGTSRGAASPGSRQEPLGILRERLARREIDQEEFDHRKRLLSD